MDSLFFIVSKIAWAFLSPSNIILILLILGSAFLLFNKVQSAKTLLLPASFAGLIVLVFPIGDLLIQPLEQRFKTPESLPKHIDGIIILGGGEDLKLSLSWGRPELGIGGDRYIGAKELATRYPKVPVIFTGGSGSMQLQNTEGEGSLARQLLTTLGIANKRLIIESLSRNTYENFKFTKHLLPDTNGTYMLVTSNIIFIDGYSVVPGNTPCPANPECIPVIHKQSGNSFGIVTCLEFNFFKRMPIISEQTLRCPDPQVSQLVLGQIINRVTAKFGFSYTFNDQIPGNFIAGDCHAILTKQYD